MTTEKLRFSQVPDETLAWLMAKYKAVDSMNSEAYAAFLATDCELNFGNNPTAQGRDEVLSGIRHFWGSISGLNHHFTNVFGQHDHFAAEALIDYIRKDNKVVKVPCVTTIQRNAEGQARRISIYIDITPIFQ